MKQHLLICIFLVFSFYGFSQNVAINNDNSLPDAKALLDIKSTAKGILIPRMLKAEREAITSPPQGLLVYQTEAPEGIYYQAAVTGLVNWKRMIPTDGQNWSLSVIGDHISNSNTGNVGIGNNSPSQAGLVVDRKVDKVHAMFGALSPGVAIESNNPGIGFNSYFNGSRKAMGNGYGGLIGMDAATGDFYIQSSLAAGTFGNPLALNTRMWIDKTGKVGLEGNNAPHAVLSFASTLGSKISLYGSSAGTNYGLGVQGSLMQLYAGSSADDIAFGYGGSAPADFTENMRIKGNGKVGIGTTNPLHTLTVEASGDGIITKSGTVEIGTYVNSGAAYFQTYSSHPLYFATANASAQMALLVNGNFGVGTSSPAAKLEVAGQVKITGGTPGLNKILTSDAAGLASWQAAAFSGTGTINFIPKFNTVNSLSNSSIAEVGTNIGIGLVPGLAKLQVQGAVGNTVGYFNAAASSQGIALVADVPGLYFNCYYNGGVKAMAGTGYPSIINSTQTNGDIIFQTTAVANTTIGGAVTVPERMRITGTGNVGIGETAPVHLLDVAGNSNAELVVINNGSSAGSPVGLHATCFYGASIGIRGSGNNAGVEGLAYDKGVSGFAFANTGYGVYGGGGLYAGYFSGNVFSTGSYLPSDRSLKNNIAPLKDAMSIINRLQPSVYNYKTKEYKQMRLPEGLRYGLIADEVQKVLPGIVKRTIEPADYERDEHGLPGKKISEAVEFNAINYTEMIPILIAAVKEQNQLISELKKRIEVLEKK